jgi:ribonucleoside-diphosphate reductase alpha chain
MTTIDVNTPRGGNSIPVRRQKKETRTGGIEFPRYFTREGVDVFDTCRVGDAHRGDHEREGRDRLRAEGRRECRSSGRRWRPTSSSRSTSAVTSARPTASPAVRQLIGRVVRTMTGWGREGGYFASEKTATRSVTS